MIVDEPSPALSQRGGLRARDLLFALKEIQNRFMRMWRTAQQSSRCRAVGVEMRSLRSKCGVSRKDRGRNSEVRERGGLKEDVVTGAERRILRWFGHRERVNEGGLTKQIYRANVCDGKWDNKSTVMRSSGRSLFTIHAARARQAKNYSVRALRD
ncbi:hypothetical protein EVAR_36609_1 [Eumeta japonica]|uniref:Uncharacterized protein n=1 Tax=Eumeta variegata TaxID=151549 RepID=A0A4C1ZR07_EUMVA|nr:hypothetical protein EVAR_36609_1 [Eumeta japonica]